MSFRCNYVDFDIPLLFLFGVISQRLLARVILLLPSLFLACLSFFTYKNNMGKRVTQEFKNYVRQTLLHFRDESDDMDLPFPPTLTHDQRAQVCKHHSSIIYCCLYHVDYRFTYVLLTSDYNE